MATASLKNRIEKLINDLGGNPKPGTVDIRNRLTAFANLADALESGQSAIEAEQKIAVMVTTIKELEAKLKSADSQGEKLQAAFDAVRDELRGIQKQKQDSEPLSSAERRILDYIDTVGQAQYRCRIGTVPKQRTRSGCV